MPDARSENQPASTCVRDQLGQVLELTEGVLYYCGLPHTGGVGHREGYTTSPLEEAEKAVSLSRIKDLGIAICRARGRIAIHQGPGRGRRGRAGVSAIKTVPVYSCRRHHHMGSEFGSGPASVDNEAKLS